jgi:hypothetical protein
LLEARLPSAHLLVYTNPLVQQTPVHLNPQTLGVRFSDGLIGEVHVKEKTRALTEPTERNQFLVGFNTNPSGVKEQSALNDLKPFATTAVFDQYMMMFSILDKHELFKAEKNFYVFDENTQKQRIRTHGETVLAKYLKARIHDPELQAIKQLLKGSYGEYGFKCLK